MAKGSESSGAKLVPNVLVSPDCGSLLRQIQIHQALVLRRDLSASLRVDALNELGHSLEALGELDRALAAHQEVLAHARRNQIALESAERLLGRRGDFESAWVMRRRRRRGSRGRERKGGVWKRRRGWR